MEQFHGTTILSVRRGGSVALGGDGQVTLGNVVVKGERAQGAPPATTTSVLAGFAGGTADAFTLFERFEAKLEKHQGNLMRSAVELAKDWRTDRILRRLEAMLAVADREHSLIITGNGDVLEPEHGIVAIGSRRRRTRRPRPRRCSRTPSWRRDDIVKQVARRSPASCASTPTSSTSIETLGMSDRSMPASPSMTPQEIVSRARQAHRRPGRRQARGRDRAAQPLAPPAGRRAAAPARSRRRTS